VTTIYTPVKRIDAADGKSYVEIEVRDDGRFFRFVEWLWRLDPEGAYDWAPSHWSGLYPDAELAERHARATLAWLRAINSN
jgi:hypothetical protein